MTMIACAFLQSRRLKAAGTEKSISGPPPRPSLPAIRQAILDLFAPPPTRSPHCEKLLTNPGKSNLPKQCQDAVVRSIRLFPEAISAPLAHRHKPAWLFSRERDQRQ
jgi:hypothetical protein